MIPNFFIGGPPKCASTSLNFYLSQHPEIYMSPVKQTKFFSLNYDKGFDFYLKTYFSGVTNEKAVGEATPTYFLLPFVIERIKKYNQDMKFIFCLRDPVERAYSGWNMRCSLNTENLSFKEALVENLKQREQFSFDREDMARVWCDDQRRNNKQDDAGFRTYIEGSLYAFNLKKYYQHFSPSQIKIIYFNDLIKDLHGTLKEIYVFLGVDNTYKVENIEQKNTHKKSKVGFLEPIVGKNKPIAKYMARLLPKPFKKALINTMYVQGTKTTLSPEDRKFAYQLFKNDVLELEQMLRKDFSNWKHEL